MSREADSGGGDVINSSAPRDARVTRPRYRPGDGPMTSTDLLTDLGFSSDLKALVERVARDRLPWVVVSSAAVTAWTRRDPEAWAKVSAWLAAEGIAVVRI
jgi:succinylarginine dihydrolase